MAARDLTSGRVPVLVVQLALPVLASFVLQSLFQLADLFWVGRLGGTAIAGLSIAISTFFVTLALGMTCGTGALALIAQAYGRGDRGAVPALFQQALWMAVALGSTLWLAAFIGARPFVGAFTDDPAVLEAGTAFFRIYAATFLAQLLLMVVSMCFRAVGDFITPTVLMGLGVTLNMALDPLLIFGIGPFPRMGIAGAALATVFTQVVTLGLVAWLVVGPRPGRALALRRPLVLRGDLMLRMLRIGVPTGVQFLLFAAMTWLTYWVVRPYGGEATAAVGVGFRIVETGALPVVSVGAAVSSLVGQNYGAGRFARVRAAALCGMAYGGVITVAEFALLAWQPRVWVSLFTGDAAVQAIGAQYLSIVGLNLVMLGVAHPVIFAGQGLGRTLLPLLAQVLRLGGFLAGLAILVEAWGMGLAGIFWSRALSMLPEVAFLLGVLAFWWVTVLHGRGAPAPAPALAAEPEPRPGALG